MTQKQFTVIDMEDPRKQSVAENGIPCTARHCCTRLNRLTEENEQLKIQNKQTTEILEKGGVILTKHQLTSIIEMKNNEESYEIRHLKTTNAKLKDEIEAFKKENKQLKLQLRNISAQRDEFFRGARENANRVGKLKKKE